jgi:hypothetical protein
LFKKGDKVVCIDDIGSEQGVPFGPKKGEHYIIDHTDSTSCGIIKDEMSRDGLVSGGWFIRRFELVKIKGTCSACNSKCKKDKPCGLYMEE